MIDGVKLSPQVAELFKDSHLHYMIEAMVAGNSPARVWVTDVEQPRSVIIWDQAHCLYFGGTASDPVVNQALTHFITTSLLPQVHEREMQVLKVYASDAVWEQQAMGLLHSLHPQRRHRSLYIFSSAVTEVNTPRIPAGFRVQRIDRDFLRQKGLSYQNQVVEEIESCWTSLERFLHVGFGYCLISDRYEVVSWCTAEYVSPGQCGIGIETIEAYQRQGFAKVSASAFLQHALSLGWQMYWDTWQGNIASVHVAQNLGFRKAVDYSVLLVHLD